MPVIVFASSKGGSGKTTSCMILASEFSRHNVGFSLIDADPNQHLKGWADSIGNLECNQANQSNILDIIERLESKNKFVLIDLEGSANMTMCYAISQADLVVIPCKPSDLDGKEAIKIVSFIKQQEKVTNRAINYSLLRTQTGAAIYTKIEQAIVEDFKSIGANVFLTRLTDREAYKSAVSYSCYIHDLKAETQREKTAKEKAITTANEFALEVIEYFK